MYSIKFYTKELGWFSTYKMEYSFGIPFQTIRKEIELNVKHWESPITYTVHLHNTDITDLYEKWVSERDSHLTQN